ncbi:caspase family protein [Paramagnetospirillum magneticum]|uniref:Uncharacterized protein containing caspase domain n=1 Tax=Paramagnetospirillum magneticum (strain ATCC 700264 / AMB-1) TaxID=342108 RepID=Q2W3D6_PARM1|nr:caspase family protein [Paramagnetospirillum magneticum]BAE51639.1 Uncharacterized protein containing caspase domain [Paramagnetospirillum magneticum AMB-1]
MTRPRIAVAAAVALAVLGLSACETRTGKALGSSAQAAGEGKVVESAVSLAVAPLGVAIDAVDLLFNGFKGETATAIRNSLPSDSAVPSPQIAQDTKAPPSIVVEPVGTTTEQVVEIKGAISSQGKITSARINGTDVTVMPDGRFAVRRGVQLGDNVLQLTATDEWGQTSETTISVNRQVAPDQSRLAALVPESLRGAPRPQSIAIIVGIQDYETLPKAEFAENDARRFYDYATNALGVPPDRVKLITGADARLITLRKALHNWSKPLIVRGQTEVFVFFAGHGLASEDGGELYLLPYDGDRTLLAGSSLRRREIVEQVTEAGASSVTLFLDTCYSGSARGGETLLAGARPVTIVPKAEDLPANVTVFSATTRDQVAHSLPAARHGLFSYYLMKGLESGAVDVRNQVTAESLESYLIGAIPAQAARQGGRQMPQMAGPGTSVIAKYSP